MSEAMLEKARTNAEKPGLANVDFREGPIEELPIEAETVDVVLSNCAITTHGFGRGSRATASLKSLQVHVVK